MVTACSYRLLSLLLLLYTSYTSVYAMHTLARTKALHKIPARTYAHAARKFCTAYQAHTNFKLLPTNNHSSDEQSNSQEQQSKEQRYQKFKNRLYAASALAAGVSTGSDDKDHALFQALTTGNEETIKTLLENNNFSDDYLHKLLNYAVEHNNYTLFLAVLEVLDRKNLGDTSQNSYTIPNNLQKLWNNSHKVIDLGQMKQINDVRNHELQAVLNRFIREIDWKDFRPIDLESPYCHRTISTKEIYYAIRDELKEAIIKAYKHESLNISLVFYDNSQRYLYNLQRCLLHTVVLSQDYELMSLLIKAGTNPNIQDSKRKETPLFSVQSPVVARFLINAGARTDVQNNDGNTPAHKALLNGNIALAQVLLSPQVEKIKNRDGYTPLQILCNTCATLSLNAQPGTLELLDQLTQDKQMLSQVHPKLTHIMRDQNNQDCVILARILENLARNPLVTAAELWPQYHTQAHTLQADFTDTLIHNKQEYYHTHKQAIQKFIQAGHDIHMPVTSDDSTLLHVAIYFNDLETAAYLVKNGASIHARNIQGQTPLFCARTYAAYRFLKEQGALLTVKDTNKRSLLYYAMQHGYDPQLVGEYAHLEQKNSVYGWQYLIDACKESTSQELMAKVHAYLAARPLSIKSSATAANNYKLDSTSTSNCATLVEVLKKLAQQTT